jgi:hypothetical protein
MQVLNQDVAKLASKWVAHMHKKLLKYYDVPNDPKFIEIMK